MLSIRTAVKDDLARIHSFYDSLIDGMEHAAFKPAWEKGVYPSPAFLAQAIEEHALLIGERDGCLAACLVANHAYNEVYRQVRWSIDAPDEKLLVIHALGVHPRFAGQGIAKQMVRHVIGAARENGIQTIRLDVADGNLPAEKVYQKLGFTHLDTLSMEYTTGSTTFKVFEYLI